MKSYVIAALAATALAVPSHFGAGRTGEDTGLIGFEPATSGDSPKYQIVPGSHVTGGDGYVVIFNSSAEDVPELSDVLRQLDLSEDHDDVKYTYNNKAFRGFAAKMKAHCLDALANMTGIAVVAPDVEVSAYAVQRSGAPWGLQRISSGSTVRGDPQALAYQYTYDGSTLGAGVDIYVVDTGVYPDHVVFGGRAKLGYSFQADTTDGDGHGTHVSGTAAGDVVGVASGANVIGVKTLGNKGTGTSSDTVKGMDWVIQQHNIRKTQPGFVGSVMSMSWGLQSTNIGIDSVIRAATAAGIHVSVAAGNDGVDACDHSPASSAGQNGPAIAVGSVGMTNAISTFSNTGSCVDIYAPGENIMSAWPSLPNMLQPLSGTSMATPHVTGIIAYWAAERPDLAQNPAAMKAFLTSTALRGVISGRPNAGDPMILVNNGQTPALRKRTTHLDTIRDVVLRRETRRALGSSTLGSIVELGSRLGDRLSNILRRGPAPLRLVLRGWDEPVRVAY